MQRKPFWRLAAILLITSLISSQHHYLPSEIKVRLNKLLFGPSQQSPETSTGKGKRQAVDTSLNNTKIVAVANAAYKEIAYDWYQRLSKLGYTTHIVATVDEEAHQYLEERGVAVETILPRTSGRWPLPLSKPQVNRRRIFGTRWVHLLAHLRRGHNVLLTDADNIFSKYLPMEDLESSKFDVFHAYAGNFPIRFLSMGFTVCGGMVWVRASPAGIRYVESVLGQCAGGWNGDISGMIQCDDQQVVNSKFFFNSLNYTFTTEKPSEDTFWKNSLEGKSVVTGHTFKIWDVDTAYRGPIDGKDGVCPKNNWVSMPLNSISDPNHPIAKGGLAGDRALRLKQWMQYCGED